MRGLTRFVTGLHTLPQHKSPSQDMGSGVTVRRARDGKTE